MSKKLKITESQLKKLVEMYDEPEMQPGKFDSTSELLHSVTGRLANALQMKDWYLVKEVFMDISHYNEEDTSTHGLDTGDSTLELSKGAMDYNMNESFYDYFPNEASKGDDLKNQIIDLLHELKEYFHDRADADGDSEGMYPNKEMQIQTSIEDLLSQIDLEKSSESEHDSSEIPGFEGTKSGLDNLNISKSSDESHINESVQKIKNQFKRFF